jgi:hypothetical protein
MPLKSSGRQASKLDAPPLNAQLTQYSLPLIPVNPSLPGIRVRFPSPHGLIRLADTQKVCNYGPEGNVLGYFNSEISEPLGHPTITATIT